MKSRHITLALIYLVLISQVVSQQSFDDIDDLLEKKLANSPPAFNQEIFSRVMKTPNNNPSKHSARPTVSGLSALKNQVFRHVLRVDNFEVTIEKLPYFQAMSLKWGNRLESLSYESKMTSEHHQYSYVSLYGMMAQKIGNDIKMIVVLGVSIAQNIPQHIQIRYRHCEKILFWDDCSWRHRWEPRAFNFDEMMEANKGLINQAQLTAAYAGQIPKTGDSKSKKMLKKSDFKVMGLLTQEGTHGPKTLLET